MTFVRKEPAEIIKITNRAFWVMQPDCVTPRGERR